MFLDVAVLGVVRIECVGETPLVASEEATRLERAQYLAVGTGRVRRMAGGFDLVGVIESVICKWELHEIAFNHGAVAEMGALAQDLVAAIDLVGIVVEASNAGATKGGNAAERPPDASANVEHLRSD